MDLGFFCGIGSFVYFDFENNNFDMPGFYPHPVEAE